MIFGENQAKKAWKRFGQPKPVGAVLHAKLVDGFCTFNAIGSSRNPPPPPGEDWKSHLDRSSCDSEPRAPSSGYESGTGAYGADTKTLVAIEHVEQRQTVCTRIVYFLLLSARMPTK